MSSTATKEQIDNVEKKLSNLGFKTHPIFGEVKTVIGAIGDKRLINNQIFVSMPGVENIVPIMKPFKLVGRELNLLDGGPGADTLRGGDGADTYLIDRADTVIEDADGGFDTIVASFGFDLTPELEHLTLIGRADLDGRGTAFDNLMEGNAGDNRLDGLGGNDELIGGKGDDHLLGGPGFDTLRGGQGADLLEGGADSDTLDGDGGADELHGGADGDTLRGGGGADRLFGEAGFDQLEGGAGGDLLAGGADKAGEGDAEVQIN
jgi:Ca2+-binding RTX toxin-like protein